MPTSASEYLCPPKYPFDVRLYQVSKYISRQDSSPTSVSNTVPDRFEEMSDLGFLRSQITCSLYVLCCVQLFVL